MTEASTLCARHAGTEATFTCSRCGSFGCEVCRSAREALLCLPCQAVLEPPALRGGVDLAALLKGTVQQIAEHFRMGCLVLVVPGLILATCWYLAPIAVVLDRTPITQSVGLSFELTSERRWLVFFLLILEAGLALCVYALDMVNAAVAVPEAALLVLDLITTLLTAMITAAFETLAVLLYLRLRSGSVRRA